MKFCGFSSSSSNEKNQSFGTLLFLSLLLFSISIALRCRYFGEIASENSEASTGDILRWTRMWFEEGPVNVRFQMPDLFKSVEFPDLSTRGIYLSYPPGVVLFPYVISLLLGQYPSPSILMGANLLGHFFAGVCAGRMIQVCLARSGCQSSFIYGSVGIALVLVYFSRGPFYFLQNVYVHDTAVILWISLVAIIELQVWIRLSRSENPRRAFFLLQFLFSFLALFTDWSTYFLLFILFLTNLIFFYRSQKKGYLLLALTKLLAGFFATALFVIIVVLNGYDGLSGRFANRFGGGAGHDLDQHVLFNPNLFLDM